MPARSFIKRHPWFPGRNSRLWPGNTALATPAHPRATNGLDVKTERAILQSLRALKEEMAVLVVSHQDAVRNVADHIVDIRPSTQPDERKTQGE